MPTSFPDHISFVIKTIMESKPKTVLDCGTGMGKFGFLCREMLDIYKRGDQWRTSERKTTIDGVEIFKPYLDEFKHLHYIYDNIYNCSVLDFEFKDYDCIILGDVLEHIDKEEGIKLLHKIINHSRIFVLSVPLGNFLYEFKGENKYESHISVWEENELIKYPNYKEHKIYPLVTSGGKKLEVGVFIYENK